MLPHPLGHALHHLESFFHLFGHRLHVLAEPLDVLLERLREAR